MKTTPNDSNATAAQHTPGPFRLQPTDKHSRTWLAVGLPRTHPSDCAELEITIGYTGEGNGYKGAALDHHVIPLIAQACNGREILLARNAELLAALEYMVNCATADGWSGYMTSQARAAIARAKQA